MTWQNYISSDPRICHGQACVRGTRIPVSVVLDNLAEGRSETQILRSYPTLSTASIRAALDYAAYLSKDRVIELVEDEA